MPTPSKTQTLIDLETKFWQSMALMVSSHGAMKFDHATYRKMAEHGSMVVTGFELSNVETVFPNDKTAILTYRVKQAVASRENGESTEQEMNDTSTWVKTRAGWKCVMHTETPVGSAEAH